MWLAKKVTPLILIAGLWSMNGCQFSSAGSSIGAVTTRKFLALRLVVM